MYTHTHIYVFPYDRAFEAELLDSRIFTFYVVNMTSKGGNVYTATNMYLNL
jgi:hypothetical protein